MQDLGCKYLLILFLHYLTPFLSFSFVGLYIDNFLMLNDFSTAVIVSSGQVLWVDFGQTKFYNFYRVRFPGPG